MSGGNRGGSERSDAAYVGRLEAGIGWDGEDNDDDGEGRRKGSAPEGDAWFVEGTLRNSMPARRR